MLNRPILIDLEEPKKKHQRTPYQCTVNTGWSNPFEPTLYSVIKTKGPAIFIYCNRDGRQLCRDANHPQAANQLVVSSSSAPYQEQEKEMDDKGGFYWSIRTLPLAIVIIIILRRRTTTTTIMITILIK